MRVIGNPGDQAFAINNRGQVTGVSNVAISPLTASFISAAKEPICALRLALSAAPALRSTTRAM
jgi:hypothetical protein